MSIIIVTLTALAVTVGLPARAAAHCDALDGPVVKAAERALESGDVSPALIWVAPDAEAELRAAFASARDVRALAPAARALADRYFFETIVRLHRAGEGEPYTGLKPAGEIAPVIRHADEALDTGSVEPFVHMLAAALHEGLASRFRAALDAKRIAAKAGDVDAGRAYVKAYVEFMHYAERVHEAAGDAAGGPHQSDAHAAR